MIIILAILASEIVTTTILVLLFKAGIIKDKNRDWILDSIEDNYNSLLQHKLDIEYQGEVIEELRKQVQSLQNKGSTEKRTRRSPKKTQKNE